MKKIYFYTLLVVILLTSLSSPQQIKSETNHIVISEIQIAGGTTTDEFVELYNPTLTPVVMTNWRLTRKNSVGTEANLVSSLNGTIPAFGYFLIGHETGYDGAVSLDVPYSAPSNALTNNYTVLLYSDAGITLIDKVGFGTAVDFEVAPFSTNPSVNGSIERASETDNNSVDFRLREISDPQNSQSIVATPSPTATASPTPTLSPTQSPDPTSTPIQTPTLTPNPTPIETSTPTPSPTPTDAPKGWLKSPVFVCSNSHVPGFVYELLKLIMPYKFSC